MATIPWDPPFIAIGSTVVTTIFCSPTWVGKDRGEAKGENKGKNKG